MKAIMISIKPKWVAKILNGEKTIEIRKAMPKCELPIDVYIYCTKEEYLICDLYTGKARYHNIPKGTNNFTLSGKVVAKFTLNKIDKHHVLPTENILPFNWNVEKKLSELCLTKEEVMAYGNGEDYYACLWHISNLEIFDRPKELNEFYKGFRRKYHKNHFAQDIHKEKNVLVQPIKCGYEYTYSLTKSPQNFCYVEVEE